MYIKDDLKFNLAKRSLPSLLDLQESAAAIEQLADSYSTPETHIYEFIEILIKLQSDDELAFGRVETLLKAANDILAYREAVA